MQIWFDESFIYLSVRCPEMIGTEADVYLGNGQAFLRVERSRVGPSVGRPRTPAKLVLGPAC
ncbi:MAG: hypothetical protein U0800_21530 [Isosphaeraceae bacterium]